MILASIWPTTVEGWVGLIILFVGLISSLIALIPTIIKLVKALKTIVKDGNFTKLKEIAVKAIKAAEATKASGADKKAMVIAAVKEGAREAGIEIDDEALEKISKYIDEMISYYNDMTEISE